MKTLYITGLSILFYVSTMAQHTITVNQHIKSKNNFKKELLRKKATQNFTNNKGTTCDTDTLMYAQYKATTTRYINLDTGSATGVGQFFQVRDSMTIYGVNIYAYLPFLDLLNLQMLVFTLQMPKEDQ